MGIPDLSDKVEKYIDKIWEFWITAWAYLWEEVTRLVNKVIETRWVIANQLTKRGKWKCTDFCDTKNHHMHLWCEICQRRIDYEERLNHNCRFEIGHGHMDKYILIWIHSICIMMPFELNYSLHMTIFQKKQMSINNIKNIWKQLLILTNAIFLK